MGLVASENSQVSIVQAIRNYFYVGDMSNVWGRSFLTGLGFLVGNGKALGFGLMIEWA